MYGLGVRRNPRPSCFSKTRPQVAMDSRAKGFARKFSLIKIPTFLFLYCYLFRYGEDVWKKLLMRMRTKPVMFGSRKLLRKEKKYIKK